MNLKEKLIKKFGDKKILILGFGKEGQDNYLSLRKLFPKRRIAIADTLALQSLTEEAKRLIQADNNLELHLGKDYLKRLKNYQVIIKTPGINQRLINPYLKKDAILTSQTKIFFDYCPGKIIGVTGTKGKGTTAALIHQILKAASRSSHLIGNIGKPVFSLLLKAKEEDIFVYELSSHQLENLKKSPAIGIFLNIYPDHLDYYKNFKEYFSAKKSITSYQKSNNYFIYNREQKIIRDLAQKTKAQTIPFGLKDKEKIYKTIKQAEIPLKGDFNLYNIIAAVLTTQLSKVPKATISKGIKEFKPLAHHLEYIGCYKGIDFYNDSFATIPEATIGAIKALKSSVKTIILGGSSKGKIDFSPLAQTIVKAGIDNLIFFPETGRAVWQAVLKQAGKKKPKAFFVFSMPAAVKAAYTYTPRGTACLLSPACASFSIFNNYKERGNLFKQYVKQLQ